MDIYGDKNASLCLIRVTGKHEEEDISSFFRHIKEQTQKDFLLVKFTVDDWNRDLSPWPAPAVFGDEPFGGMAEETLNKICEALPDIKSSYLSEDAGFIIGGYSLAGLWALWAAYRTGIFKAVAAASPSVWFPGWTDFASEHEILCEKIYLSLGKKEALSRNPLLRTVGGTILKQDELLKDKDHILEWNEGTHFTDPEGRTAKGFIWAVNNC